MEANFRLRLKKLSSVPPQSIGLRLGPAMVVLIWGFDAAVYGWDRVQRFSRLSYPPQVEFLETNLDHFVP
jgi:hypothetical protein